MGDYFKRTSYTSKSLPLLNNANSLSDEHIEKKIRRSSDPSRKPPTLSDRCISTVQWPPGPSREGNNDAFDLEASPYGSTLGNTQKHGTSKRIYSTSRKFRRASFSADLKNHNTDESIKVNQVSRIYDNIVTNKRGSESRDSLANSEILPKPHQDLASEIPNMEENLHKFIELKTSLTYLEDFSRMNEQHRKTNAEISNFKPELHEIRPLSRLNFTNILTQFNPYLNKKNNPSQTGQQILAELSGKMSEILKDSQEVQTKFNSFQSNLQIITDILSSEDSFLRHFITETRANLTTLENDKKVLGKTIDQLKETLKKLNKMHEEDLMHILGFKDEIARLKLLVQEMTDKLESCELNFNLVSQHRSNLDNKIALISRQLKELCERNDALLGIIAEKDSLNRSLIQKFDNLVHETEASHLEILSFEREYKQMKSEIATKEELINSFKLLQEKLEQNCNFYREEATAYKVCTMKLEEKNKDLGALLLEVQKQVSHFKDQVKEKDSLLCADAQKLKNLDSQVEEHQILISALELELNENKSSYELSQTALLQQVQDLKAQISAAQQKSDERIHEIAEQLYHQYSKKHEVKMGQLRKNYEMKIEQFKLQARESENKTEILESQLRLEAKEKEYLLKALDKQLE